jgi:1-deoxy-D-xylulose-5-phosphate synthase
MNIKEYSIDELNTLCQKLREKILSTVSKNGGHLSSTLGVVELIVAMHYVFNKDKDPFIFDVSHQAYAHKLLTDRWDEFDTLREFGGISGYTKPDESPYDYFVAGHSSTSISLAVGAAKAIKLKNEDRLPIALIGDGSMSAGMVYEAMNELGDIKLPAIIILNDN